MAGLMIAGAQHGRTKKPQVGVFDGFMFLIGYLYSRIVHRAEFVVEDGVFEDIDGPMIVVCNHTCGIDPFLVSAVMPRRVCWLMAEDMRVRSLGWFWNWAGIIFVARNRHGKSGIRRARAHLKDGGIIGIFPEGEIERPAGRLLPFAPGVGVLVKRTGARVLPVVIDGTPDVSTAWDSIWTNSNARVRVMKPIDYSELDLGSAEIANDLEQRFLSWTGWELGSRQPRKNLSDRSTDEVANSIADDPRQIA
ncbi:MAG: 1-acyl-sn-glycerol-3-phosphate acyltransferase [Phycisphaerales bacterium]|nr:1-acyl-sn-glycerol-3-phosphate acyltransferase [Phycisphaerales bacterium]